MSVKDLFQEPRRCVGGYAYAKPFKRLRLVLKRQRTVPGIVLREMRRKLAIAAGSSRSRTSSAVGSGSDRLSNQRAVTGRPITGWIDAGVTSRHKPATESRHIPASAAVAKEHLEAVVWGPYFAVFCVVLAAARFGFGGTFGSR